MTALLLLFALWLLVALLPVARGFLDYLLFYRLLRGESTNPRWAARPMKLGPVEMRPYHVLLFGFDLLVYAVLFYHVAVLVAVYWLICRLFAVDDALWYHNWKGHRFRSVVLVSGEEVPIESRLPASRRIHRKALVWPVQVWLVWLFFRRLPTEGEYRTAAVIAYVIATTALLTLDLASLT